MDAIEDAQFSLLLGGGRVGIATLCTAGRHGGLCITGAYHYVLALDVTLFGPFQMVELKVEIALIEIGFAFLFLFGTCTHGTGTVENYS